MDSDEVNSINDSVESQQITKIVRNAYMSIKNRGNLPEHYSLITLDASTDATKPVLMTLPSTINKIKWVKYNKILEVGDPINMQLVEYYKLEDFLDMIHSFNEDETYIDTFSHTVGTDTFTFLYRNDKQPDFYTTFDDNTLIFDSYDSDIEATLQKSNSLCYGKLVTSFTLSDSFTPDLDEEQFDLLLNEAKLLAWAELKQAPHEIAERNTRRGWTHNQTAKYATEDYSSFNKLPYYGRK